MSWTRQHSCRGGSWCRMYANVKQSSLMTFIPVARRRCTNSGGTATILEVILWEGCKEMQ